MESKLYVGNLPYSMRDDDLQQHFAEFGQVSSAKVMMDRDTGRSKGFGFVEFEEAADAERAIAELNDSLLHGRKIFVREDREQK